MFIFTILDFYIKHSTQRVYGAVGMWATLIYFEPCASTWVGHWPCVNHGSWCLSTNFQLTMKFCCYGLFVERHWRLLLTVTKIIFDCHIYVSLAFWTFIFIIWHFIFHYQSFWFEKLYPGVTSHLRTSQAKKKWERAI